MWLTSSTTGKVDTPASRRRDSAEVSGVSGLTQCRSRTFFTSRRSMPCHKKRRHVSRCTHSLPEPIKMHLHMQRLPACITADTTVSLLGKYHAVSSNAASTQLQAVSAEKAGRSLLTCHLLDAMMSAAG